MVSLFVFSLYHMCSNNSSLYTLFFGSNGHISNRLYQFSIISAMLVDGSTLSDLALGDVSLDLVRIICWIPVYASVKSVDY